VNLLCHPLTISTSLTIAAAFVPQIAAGLVIVLLVVFVICVFLICLEGDDDGRKEGEGSQELRLTHDEPIHEKWLDNYVNVPHPLPAELCNPPENITPNHHKPIHDFRPGDFLTCVDDSGVQHYMRNGERAWFLRNHTDEGRLIWVRTDGSVKGVFCSAPGRFVKREEEGKP